MTTLPSRIYLIGFMGSGKTSVAALLAKDLGYICVDLDDEIEDGEHMSVKEIFEVYGEAHFRDLETQELERTKELENVIVACGGGIVERDVNRALLHELGLVIYLEVNAQESIARIDDVSSRPMLSGGSAELIAKSLLKARDSLYRAVADITVDTVGRDIDEIAHDIEDRIATWQ